MEDLAKLIVTPAWWVSTVIVAFLVNVAAAYVKPRFDAFLAKWFTSRKTRLVEERIREDAVVDYLIENNQRLVDARTDAIFTLLRILLALMAGVFVAAIIHFVRNYIWLRYEAYECALAIIYICFTVVALQHFKRYRRLRRIVDKCSSAIHTYDAMPAVVAKRLREEEAS